MAAFNLSAFAGAGQQFFDNSGNVLSGGKIYTYEAGTTTPATTYTTSTGTVAHSNPIVLNAAGRISTGEIWLNVQNRYKFIVKTSDDVLLNTYDNIVAVGFTSAVSFISVTDFGAIGDGITDCRDAFQSAINYATSNNIALYVPSGTYYIPNNKTTLSFTGNLTMFGDGMNNSIIYYDDSVQTTIRYLLTSSSSGNFELRDLQFKSNWGAGGDYSLRSHLVEPTSTGSSSAFVTRCKFTLCRSMSLVLINYYQVKVTDCVFQDSASDGCRIIGSQNSIVSNNQFININDDSIAIHTRDADPSPAKTNIVVSDNNITNGQGIAILGGKQVTVSGNVLTRVQSRGIFIGQWLFNTTEGSTPVVNVNIVGNSITDVFRATALAGSGGNDGGYIQVAGFQLNDIGNGYVNNGDGSGGVLKPFDYLYTNNLTSLTQIPGNWNINISENVCMRTLEPVANYSDYGFGPRLTKYGVTDPAITYDSFDIYQIRIRNYSNGVNISNNVVSGGVYWGIYLEAVSGQSVNSWDNVSITNNQLLNISNSTLSGNSNAGIRIVGKGIVKISNNLFNMDPYNTAYARAANGKWTSNYSTTSCIYATEAYFICNGNTFKNTGVIFRGASVTDNIWQKNVIIADPVNVGYDANNIGIGSILEPAYFDASYIIEDGDPASATYNSVLNICKNSQATIPTTGKYVKGSFVAKPDSVITGTAGSQYIVNGWLRLTTGIGHVLNTDWAEVRTLTGT